MLVQVLIECVGKTERRDINAPTGLVTIGRSTECSISIDSALVSRKHVTMDVRDLKTFDGPCEHEQSNSNNGTTRTFDWNDCVSSIRVAPGWRVEAYRDDDFKGQSVSTMQDIPNLQLVPGSCEHDGLNDCITSVRVVRP